MFRNREAVKFTTLRMTVRTLDLMLTASEVHKTVEEKTDMIYFRLVKNKGCSCILDFRQRP